MKSRLAIVGLVALVGAFVAAPTTSDAQQTPAEHDHGSPAAAVPGAQAQANQPGPMAEMMAHMRMADEKIDNLVARMNAATGAEKTTAIAELLTALVQDRRDMHAAMMTMSQMPKMADMPMMSNMSGMCGMAGMAGAMPGHGDQPQQPVK